MTNNTTPSGTARQRDSNSSTRYEDRAYLAFDKDVTTNASGDSYFSWSIIEYGFASKTKINGFSIYDNISTHGDYHITKYQFIASIDGTNYDVIDTYEEFPTQKRVYLFKDSLNYKWYGIKALSTNITSNAGGFAISEIELLSR